MESITCGWMSVQYSASYKLFQRRNCMLAETAKFSSHVSDLAILYAEAVGLNWCSDTM